MSKKPIRTVAALVAAGILAAALCASPSLAAADTGSAAAPAATDSAPLTQADYISQSDASLIALDTVRSMIGSSVDCTWSNDTAVSDTVPLYDFDGNINAYVLNLTTDGALTGYVYVDVNALAPYAVMFGYIDSFMLDSMMNNTLSASDHVIAASPDSLDYVQVASSAGDDTAYTYVQTKQQIKATKKELNAKYKAQKKAAKEQSLIDKMASLKKNGVPKGQAKKQAAPAALQPAGTSRVQNLALRLTSPFDLMPKAIPLSAASTTDSSGTYVNGILNMTPYIRTDFSGSLVAANAVCAPIAGLNLMRFWASYRTVNGSAATFPKLFAVDKSVAFNQMCTAMKTSASGTLPANILPGLAAYSNSTGIKNASTGVSYAGCSDLTAAPYTGNTSDLPNWGASPNYSANYLSWIRTNITNGNPLVIAIHEDNNDVGGYVTWTNPDGTAASGTFPNHAMLAVGYTSGNGGVGNYLRVATEFNRSWQNAFYKWGPTFQYACYLRY